jgi:hypothetical protein
MRQFRVRRKIDGSVLVTELRPNPSGMSNAPRVEVTILEMTKEEADAAERLDDSRPEEPTEKIPPPVAPVEPVAPVVPPTSEIVPPATEVVPPVAESVPPVDDVVPPADVAPLPEPSVVTEPATTTLPAAE